MQKARYIRCGLLSLMVLAVTTAAADLRDLIDEEVLRNIAEETSGEAAKRNLDTITLQHRMRASRQFDVATENILEQLRHYGLDEIDVLEFAADGKTQYGTQKSRPVWDVRGAALWEVKDVDGKQSRVRRLGNWDAIPLTLAQDSLSADVTASLVDIGSGIADDDYAGKILQGKLVLTSSQPEAVVERAIAELGAVGIISYAPNQKSAWWQEDDRLVRWGHLSSFPTTPAFAFMVSLGEARALQQRLNEGETILFHARVDASHQRGKYRFATAVIHGTDRSKEEIHFTCHLDHPRPGANDNASGCVSILEVARTLNALIRNGRLHRPSRSIRFLWPAEIEGSIMYLSERDDTSNIKANIHMDMVGGGPVTKSVFRISGGPYSVPSFISDLGYEIGFFVNDQTERYADGKDAAFPLVAAEGGKEPQQALMEELDMGSDHDVFFEGTWRIPGLYLHDWPDRYIHTNYDLAANIDPTKLKRAAFIGAVSAWYLANFSDRDIPEILKLLQRNALWRSAELLERRAGLPASDAAMSTRIHFELERQKIYSIGSFASLSENEQAGALTYIDHLERLLVTPEPRMFAERNLTVYVRNAEIEGPMRAFGYSYIEDKLGAKAAAELRLANYKTPNGDGGMFTYEALNFVDGHRTVSDIRDWLVAEIGDVPLEYVAEYLVALESIGVLRRQ